MEKKHEEEWTEEVRFEDGRGRDERINDDKGKDNGKRKIYELKDIN